MEREVKVLRQAIALDDHVMGMMGPMGDMDLQDIEVPPWPDGRDPPQSMPGGSDATDPSFTTVTDRVLKDGQLPSRHWYSKL